MTPLDNVCEYANTEALNDIQLIGSIPGYRRFSDCPELTTGDYVRYTIKDRNILGAFECGIGRYFDGPPQTIVRDVVISSSTNNEKLELTPVSDLGFHTVYSGPIASLDSGYPITCTVGRTTSQLLSTAGQAYAVDWDNTKSGEEGFYPMWDIGQPDRISFPNFASVVYLEIMLNIRAPATTWATVEVRINGDCCEYLGSSTTLEIPGFVDARVILHTSRIAVNSGDYAQVYVTVGQNMSYIEANPAWTNPDAFLWCRATVAG